MLHALVERLKLVVKVAPTVALYHAGVAILPFSSLARTSFEGRGARRDDERPSADQLARAVSTASALLPCKSTCLARSLATVAVLRDHAFDASLRLGVARDEAEEVIAHAWVELDGRALRDDGAADFHPLAEIEPLIR